MKNNFLPDRTHFMSGSLKYLLSDLILAVIITGIILLLLNPIIVHRGRPKISIRFNLSCDCKTDPVFVSYINSVCSIRHDFYGGCRDSAEEGRFCHA